MVKNNIKARKTRESWGQIEALPSGRYRARYSHQGSVFAADRTFDRKEDARDWLASVRLSIQRGEWVNPKRLNAENFFTYASAWIEQRRSSSGSSLGENTKTDYRRYLKNGLAWFSDLRISEITPPMVRSWHSKRAEQAATSAGHEARFMRSVLNTAVEDGIIKKNPVLAHLGRSSTGLEFRPPTEEELKLLLQEMDRVAPWFTLAILLSAFGGLRMSEWRGLRRKDLTKEGDRYFISVVRQVKHDKSNTGRWIIDKPKSAKQGRVVPLPQFLTETIDDHLLVFVRSKSADALIIPPRGTQIYTTNTAFYCHWNKARKAAGLRKDVSTPGEEPRFVWVTREHDLRAFAGTKFAQGGATLKETMDFLGHTTTVAAMAYQHSTGRAPDLADKMPSVEWRNHKEAA